MELNRDIEKYTNNYLSHDFEDVMAKYRSDNVLKVLNTYKPRKVLEIGCGMDSIFNYYRSFDLATVVEPSSLFFEKVKKDLNGLNNVEVFLNFFEEKVDELASKEFDFILLSCLLHEVEMPSDILRKIRSISTEKTILHVNVPNAKSFHLLWAVESGMIEKIGMLTQTAKSLQQNTTFDLLSLEKIIGDSDFKIIEKGSYFVKPFNHRKMFQLVENGFIDEELLNGLCRMIKYFPENGAEIFANCKVI